jgi:hypothetical protein
MAWTVLAAGSGSLLQLAGGIAKKVGAAKRQRVAGAVTSALRHPTNPLQELRIMAKGMEQKKETKKKPAKTMKEKKADKNAKKGSK